MKSLIHPALVGLVLIFGAGVRAQAAPLLLSDAETVAGWSSGATLTDERKEGRHAIAWAPDASATVASLSFSLGDRREAVARGKTLSFWYRVEGAGFKSLIVKAVAYPLADGWQAIYHLPLPPPGQWRRADLPLQAFEDQWGEVAEKRNGSLQFRVDKEKDTRPRLLIDAVRVTPLPPGVRVNTGTRKAPIPIVPLVRKERAMNLPPHPRLLFSRSDLPGMKRRAEQTEAGKAFVADLKQRTDTAMKQPVALPPRGGQWYHWYACKVHGTRLRKESPTRHVCPTGGEVYTGYPYDDVVLSDIHDRYSNDVRDLGLLYHLTDDSRYAARAREILLAYAGKYLSYPLHDINGQPKVGGGRVGPQTLDESTWLIPMAQGADAVWDTLTPADRETLKTRLFYPAAEVIRQHKMGIHNIQCWKNSAVGLVGLLFDDPALVSEAIDDPERGMQAQILRGVQEDGAWYEGAWGYHFYTMRAIQPLAEAAFRANISLYTGPVGERYKRFYLAPIELAMPDGRLPAFNDSNTATAFGNASYEIAFARWNDPRLALPVTGTKRQTLEAMVSGVEDLPPLSPRPAPSQNFPISGYAVLRAGDGSSVTYLCLKYGPHGGGHGHPDKNSFVLYGGGRVLAGDPGTANYGVPIQLGWYKTTLAHNTLVVDETNQRPSTGSCLAFTGSGDGYSAALTDAGEAAIPGVTFRRAAFLIGTDLVVFLDMVHTADKQPRLLDIAYHPSGAWAAPPPGQPAPAPPADKIGYGYLRDLRTTTVGTETNGQGRDFALSVQSPEGVSSVTFAASDTAPTTFLTGTGVGRNTEDRVPIVIARRKAASTAYHWAVAVQGKDAPRVRPVVIVDKNDRVIPGHEAAAARIEHGGAAYLVIANPEGRSLQIGPWQGSDKLTVVKL